MLAIALTACENTYWSCLRGNGIIMQETRGMSPFNGVVSEGEFEIAYIPDTACFVVLNTDENLLDYIRTRISGETLVVDNGTRKCLRSEYPIQIFVHAPEIKLMSLVGSGMISGESVYTDELSLRIEGSGIIDVKGIDVLDLQVLITGSGEVDIWGRTETADYTLTGSGTISAQNLMADIAVAEISGSGSIYCWAVQKLNAIISGSGTIFYKGNPSLSTHISGSGSVNSID